VTNPASPFDALMEEARQAYAARRPAEAIVALQRASALATSGNQFRSIAHTHRRFGRMELAAAAFRAVLQHEPRATDAYLHLSLLQKWRAPDNDLRTMLALYDTGTADERIPLGFALGKIYDDLGDIDRSFAFYGAANASRRAQLAFSMADTAAQFAATKALFTPALFARFAGAGNTAEQPIFIVGMPRSGSTLTEQILASHPAVLGGGEMNLLDRVEATMLHDSRSDDLGEFLGKVAPRAMAAWAGAYLQPVHQALGSKTRFTDKNLDNFRRVGLIRLLFPNARIVHCTRDPLDNALSIYRRLFGGNSVPFGYDQSEIGHYHQLYRDLMRHWHDVLPGFVYDHSYEALVAEPEPSMRKLLEFCRLDWTPTVRDFHKTERGITTASATQVRQPVYAASVGIADAYHPHLQPLIDALGN